MKKILLGLSTGILAVALTGCENHESNIKSSSTSTSSTKSKSEKMTNFKITKSSQPLSNNLTPEQTAALVMYYNGAKNNESYVRNIANEQQIKIEMYDTNKAETLGVNNLPNNAKVIYKVSLPKLKVTIYYTIVGNDFYIANSKGRFSTNSVMLDEMIELANQNNAGNMIKMLASHTQVDDKSNTITSKQSESSNSTNAETTTSKQVENSTSTTSFNATSKQSENNSSTTDNKSANDSSKDDDLTPEERMNLPQDDPRYIPRTHDNFEGYTDGPNGLVPVN